MSLRTVAVWASILLATGGVSGQRPDCTLEPTEGRRQARLPDNVTATMTWSAVPAGQTSDVRVAAESGYSSDIPGCAEPRRGPRAGVGTSHEARRQRFW